MADRCGLQVGRPFWPTTGPRPELPLPNQFLSGDNLSPSRSSPVTQLPHRLETAMRPVLRRLIFLTVFGYVLTCAGLYLFQRSLLYFPQPRSIAAPTLTLPTSVGNTLVSVHEREGTNALIYFGGNGEDASLNLPDFSLAFPDYSIYLLHYRGYGGSAGVPSEVSLVQDALALFEVVQAKHKNIAIVGRSLGSGIAVHLASVKPASRLALITPYDSIVGIASQQFPYIPVRWLLSDKYESGTYAARVTIPTLIIMAENDEVIPRRSTEDLYSRFGSGLASLMTIPDVGHNNISDSSLYLGLLKQFLYRR